MAWTRSFGLLSIAPCFAVAAFNVGDCSRLKKMYSLDKAQDSQIRFFQEKQEIGLHALCEGLKVQNFLQKNKTHAMILRTGAPSTGF